MTWFGFLHYEIWVIWTASGGLVETIFYNRLSGSQFEKVFLRQRISVLIDVGCCLRQKKAQWFPTPLLDFHNVLPNRAIWWHSDWQCPSLCQREESSFFEMTQWVRLHKKSTSQQEDTECPRINTCLNFQNWRLGEFSNHRFPLLFDDTRLMVIL